MSEKLLIIAGPTATGKTTLAVKLAKKLKGEIVSADSRQIYQQLDIGTGKDHPPETKIHLLDLVKPNQSFSVAEYLKLACPLIKNIQKRGFLPIVVGGTGFYLKALLEGIPTAGISPRPLLRFFLNPLPASLLKKILATLNPSKYQVMNHSDQNNPRRLIRAIELSFSPPPPPFFHHPLASRLCVVHLFAPLSFLKKRIHQRVQKRLKLGLLQEVEFVSQKYSWKAPGLNTLAYKEFKDYFQKKKNLKNCVTNWEKNEIDYARRQLVWFKKQKKDINCDISQPFWEAKAIKAIYKWYTLK